MVDTIIFNAPKGGINRFQFPFNPQTWVRTTQKAKIIFRIPETCSKMIPGLVKKKWGKGFREVPGFLPCIGQDPKFPCEHKLSISSLRYKRRLIKYSEYKETLHGWAKQHHFNLTVSGTGVYFFIPMPKRWNNTKRKMYHMQEHHRKPDLSNLLKAFEDALLPKKDESVSGYSGLKKFWVDSTTGWIEIHMNMPQYNPLTGQYEVMKSAHANTFNDKV